MGKKKEYKEANRRFLKNLSFQEGVFALPCGIYYKILETGEGTVSPGARGDYQALGVLSAIGL